MILIWRCVNRTACLVSPRLDRKSTRLNSSHLVISYAVFCLKKKTQPERLRISSTYDVGAVKTRCTLPLRKPHPVRVTPTHPCPSLFTHLCAVSAVRPPHRPR